MRININTDLSKFTLYRDLSKLIVNAKVNEQLNELPEIYDYHYSYFEKLWELLRIRLPKEVKSYAMNEIWAWKGTLKVIPLLEKWFGIRAFVPNANNVRSAYSNGVLTLSFDLTYIGNQPQLLTNLITEYFRFLLFFRTFKVTYNDLKHIIEVDYKSNLISSVVGFHEFIIDWKQ